MLFENLIPTRLFPLNVLNKIINLGILRSKSVQILMHHSTNSQHNSESEEAIIGKRCAGQGKGSVGKVLVTRT